LVLSGAALGRLHLEEQRYAIFWNVKARRRDKDL